jgi:Uma2 family endonuclease
MPINNLDPNTWAVPTLHSYIDCKTLAMLITLEEFLTFPETKPASEYIAGKVIQKTMPLGKHSVIRSELMMVLNQPDIMFAFPELRCVFAGSAVVPDLAVFEVSNIPCDEDGTIANDFNLAPDWVIEISSPDQATTKKLDKIFYCLQHGTRLGWLVNIEERSVIIHHSDEQIEIIHEQTQELTVPNFVKSLKLTAGDIFGWLKLS